MKKRIYKTVISYTILSETPYSDESLLEVKSALIDLESSGCSCCGDGDFFGGDFKTSVLNQELVGKNAVNAITALNLNPEFFMMDCEGNEIKE